MKKKIIIFWPKKILSLLPLPVKKILNIHPRKKNQNKNYLKFSHFSEQIRRSNLAILPPGPPPICKTFNIHRGKKNYVEFDFSMGTDFLIFLNR